jgi:hypothetical protein
MSTPYYTTSYWPQVREYMANPSGKEFPFACCGCVACVDNERPWPFNRCPPKLRIHGHDSNVVLPMSQSSSLKEEDYQAAMLLPCGHLVGELCLSRHSVWSETRQGPEPMEERIGFPKCPVPRCKYEVKRNREICRHGLVFKRLDRDDGPIPSTIPDGGKIRDLCIRCDWEGVKDRYVKQVNMARAEDYLQLLLPVDIEQMPGFAAVCKRFLQKVNADGYRLWTMRPSATSLLLWIENKARQGLNDPGSNPNQPQSSPVQTALRRPAEPIMPPLAMFENPRPLAGQPAGRRGKSFSNSHQSERRPPTPSSRQPSRTARAMTAISSNTPRPSRTGVTRPRAITSAACTRSPTGGPTAQRGLSQRRGTSTERRPGPDLTIDTVLAQGSSLLASEASPVSAQSIDTVSSDASFACVDARRIERGQ